MPWQLIYTSVPRGLQAGQSGYCTAAYSVGIRPMLIQTLEQLSAYDHQAKFGHPVISAYRQTDLQGQKYHVLTRIQDAGLDFSGRSNYLAQHLVFASEELVRLPSPAAILLLWSGWLKQWAGEPRLLAELPLSDFQGIARRSFLPAQNWRSVTGDGGKAAGLLSPQYAKGCFVVMQPGQEDLLLALFAESLQLLNPTGQTATNAWRYTFTTFAQGEDNLADFRWRGGWQQTPGFEKAVQLGGAVLEPAAIAAPPSELAILAREGRLPIRVTSAQVEAPRSTEGPAPIPPRPPVAPGAPAAPRAPASHLTGSKRRTLGSKVRSRGWDASDFEELAPPTAPRQAPRSGKALVICVCVAVVAVTAFLAYRVWRSRGHERRALVSASPTNQPAQPSRSATKAQPAHPASQDSQPDLRQPDGGSVFLFLGSTCRDIKTDEVAPLVPMMSQGSETLTTNLQCFLVETNQAVAWKGQRIDITKAKDNKLYIANYFGLVYIRGDRSSSNPRGQASRVDWESRSENQDFRLQQELTNFFVSISFEWMPSPSSQKTNFSMVVLNADAVDGQPLKLGKSQLLPDKSGLERYEGDLAHFLRRYTLATNLYWRMIPMVGGKGLYSEWKDCVPANGNEINFADTRSRLARELEKCNQLGGALTNSMGKLKNDIKALKDQDLALGSWLGCESKDSLRSFDHFCQNAKADQDGSAQVQFLSYLHRLVNNTADPFKLRTIKQEPQKPKKSKAESKVDAGINQEYQTKLQQFQKDLEAYQRQQDRLQQIANAKDTVSLCNVLDQRLKELTKGEHGPDPIKRYYQKIGSDARVSGCSKRARDLDRYAEQIAKEEKSLASNQGKINELSRYLGAVAEGCWERIEEIQLIITDTKDSPTTVPFMVFTDEKPPAK